MELLKIVLQEPLPEAGITLQHKLQSQLAGYHVEVNGYAVNADYTIRLSTSEDRRYGKMYNTLADILADYVIDYEEKRIIRNMIKNQLLYKEEQDIVNIEQYCWQFLFCHDESEWTLAEARQFRKQKIRTRLKQYLEDDNLLNISGFITFRLSEYVDDLREVVEYAHEEFQLDQQYQEFIALLQYFVYIQEAKIPVVHLFPRGGKDFTILDHSLQPIPTEEIDASFTIEVLNHHTNFEDVIVSTLITVSPQQIHIHTPDPNTKIIQTISQIFENRVELCNGCSLCKSNVNHWLDG